MKNILCAIALAAGFAMPSQAAINIILDGDSQSGPIANNNDFKDELNGMGINTLYTDVELELTANGTIEFFFLGAESFWLNQFDATNGQETVSYAEQGLAGRATRNVTLNYPGISFGSLDFNAGDITSSFSFYSEEPATITVDQYSFGVMTDGSLTGLNEVIFALDDDGIDADDDNHDDLLILARFTSAVPEPATWLMMIMGFGLVGVASRRRKQVSSLA